MALYVCTKLSEDISHRVWELYYSDIISIVIFSKGHNSVKNYDYEFLFFAVTV